MTATNMCSNFGGKWDSKEAKFYFSFLKIAITSCDGHTQFARRIYKSDFHQCMYQYITQKLLNIIILAYSHSKVFHLFSKAVSS